MELNRPLSLFAAARSGGVLSVSIQLATVLAYSTSASNCSSIKAMPSSIGSIPFFLTMRAGGDDCGTL